MLRIVADDHGDGHGFAQGARQRQKYGAEDAGARPGHDHLPGGFPARGAQRQGGFALFARDGQQHFAGDGNDEGHDHDGQNNAGGQKAHAVIRAPGKSADKGRLPRVLIKQRVRGWCASGARR